METLRRYHIDGVPYFITAVTYGRLPILVGHAEALLRAWSHMDLEAWVILPDHVHFIVNVTRGNISQLMHRFKIQFSRYYRDRVAPGRVWQNRFYDHIIRSDEDLRNHIEYIHYNPTHHGQCKRPADWTHSSFSRLVDAGYYEESWGETGVPFYGEFGE